MDSEILSSVSGQSASSLRRDDGYVNGYAQCEVVGQDFPVLIARPNAVTRGIVISGLSALALDRILFFEGDEYRLKDIDVQTDDDQLVACQYFTDTAVYDVRDTAWDFADWKVHEKAEFLVRTRNFMKLFGTMSATAADAYW